MIIFITGGARSGKSEYAVSKAKKTKNKVAFIATCTSDDEEMLKRIELHKKARPKEWETIEEGIDLTNAIRRSKKPIIIIDCLTLWIANLMSSKMDVMEKSKELLYTLNKLKKIIIIVSNEVGLGIVPENKLAREFRDIAGFVNQRIANTADEVYLLVSGIPVKIKGGKNVRENIEED